MQGGKPHQNQYKTHPISKQQATQHTLAQKTSGRVALTMEDMIITIVTITKSPNHFTYDCIYYLTNI